MLDYIVPVEPAKAYRLINHGPTTLVSARYNGADNVMAASWVCATDYEPARLTVVLDKTAFTRGLIEKAVPLLFRSRWQASLTRALPRFTFTVLRSG